MWWISLLLAILYPAYCLNPAIEEEEIRARVYLRHLNSRQAERNTKLNVAEWAYASNITDENLQNLLTIKAQMAKETKDDWLETTKFSWQYYQDYDLHRQFKKYSVLGPYALAEDKFTKLEKIKSEMEGIYAKAKICSFKNNTKCDLALEPEITETLQSSRDPEELKHVWVEWRKAVGPKVRQMYKEYVDLSNTAAIKNNFTDNSEYWLDNYEAADIKQQIQALWEQVKPLYMQIHAYVRYQLRKKYGDIVSEKGPIPAHLLGNMWAQSWGNTFDFTVPYPGKKSVDITEELKEQDYTPTKIFKKAEEFFVSINLTAMPELFWKNSILEKPNDRELICHASAWDFSDGKDFRIKQCTRINSEDFETAHHEMGHIQYYLQYRYLPFIYQEGANEGFHEAVGDVIALSVQTTKHLRRVGLLRNDSVDDPETVLNNLYKVGLDKIVFLPFGYLIDLWRWDVFSGKITPDQYNCKWWELRNVYQGVEPPVNRSEEDFDPAAKYHIVADVPYIRYFVSFIIQFQFHRALCEKAGQYIPGDESKPLHECDIYQSTVAGNALGNMLQLGGSRPWPDAMEVLTGQRNMDASGLLEYFRPLQNWLEDYNKKNRVYVGWEQSSKVCTNGKEESES